MGAYFTMGHHNGLLTKLQNGTLETRNLEYKKGLTSPL